MPAAAAAGAAAARLEAAAPALAGVLAAARGVLPGCLPARRVCDTLTASFFAASSRAGELWRKGRKWTSILGILRRSKASPKI